MKICLLFNRWTKPWPNIITLPPEWDEFTMPDCDYYVYVGPNTEMIMHPEMLVNYGEHDILGCLVEGISVHDIHPDCKAPLGFPLYSEDCFVLKNCDKAQEFLSMWNSLESVSLAVHALHIKPVEYQGSIIIKHCDPTYLPKVIYADTHD